ncbi:hypothetical protein I3760_08G116900 [Carya illinoinensis]|nr:hypothetical protein I3760_08G116900 [Carya illinoinensis]
MVESFSTSTEQHWLKVRCQRSGLRTLPHSAAITLTVDWHPTLPISVSGSADNSV